MANDDFQQRSPQYVLNLQIIVMALIVGLVTFSVVAMVIQPPTLVAAKFGGGQLLSWFGIVFALGGLVAATVVPRIVVAGTLRQIARLPPAATGDDRQPRDAEALLQLFQSKTIIAAALLEGGGFFNNVAYLIEGDLLSLVAVGVAVATIAVLVPSKARIANWVEDQQRRIDEERALAR